MYTFTQPAFFGEIAFMLWLVIKGLEYSPNDSGGVCMDWLWQNLFSTFVAELLLVIGGAERFGLESSTPPIAASRDTPYSRIGKADPLTTHRSVLPGVNGRARTKLHSLAAVGQTPPGCPRRGRGRQPQAPTTAPEGVVRWPEYGNFA